MLRLLGVRVGGGALPGRGQWARRLWSAQCLAEELVLSEGEGEGGRRVRLPHPWLRDNCRCPACFHAPSHSRIIDIRAFPFHAKPVHFNVVGGEWLDVRWCDGHRSRYGLGWLCEPRPRDLVPDPRPWAAHHFPDVMRRFSYGDVLHKDECLEGWLRWLVERGVALLEGAPTRPGCLQPLANRVAFLKPTYYGETFAVRAKPDTSNVAYLPGALQLHTDLPYYHYKPGINLLHCLRQGEGSEGGESELCDGLAVSEWLRTTHPHHFRLLASTPVSWEDRVREEGGRAYHAVHRAPVICVDGEGRVVGVNWSQPQRGSDRLSADWYTALHAFTARMHSDHCKARYRMAPGEILTFDNVRLLHGRATYEGERHLEGGYLDWDHVRSKIRVLAQQRHHSAP